MSAALEVPPQPRRSAARDRAVELVWQRRRGEWFAAGVGGTLARPKEGAWVIAATRTQAARALYALLGVSCPTL